jgi:DNA-binding NarL/FixJ family response regulator
VSSPTRIVIADDSLLVREGIARLLAVAGFEIVGQAGDVEGLLDLVETTAPDVAIVDIRMPPTFTDEGLRAVAAMRSRPGGDATGVLVLSQHTEPAFARRLLEEGSRGTLSAAALREILRPAPRGQPGRRVRPQGRPVRGRPPRHPRHTGRVRPRGSVHDGRSGRRS